MSTPSKAVTSGDFVAISKLAFSWLALKESKLHWSQINLAAWILSQDPGELWCLGWPLCYSSNNIWIHCLKSRWCLPCKMIIPLKCNLKINVQMYQKQQKGECIQCKKQEQILIWRVFKRSFQISKDVYASKNSSALKMLYLQYTYVFLLILGDIWVNILMAFQELNGSFLKDNVIYSYLACQWWKNLIPFPPSLYYYCAALLLLCNNQFQKII